MQKNKIQMKIQILFISNTISKSENKQYNYENLIQTKSLKKVIDINTIIS